MYDAIFVHSLVHSLLRQDTHSRQQENESDCNNSGGDSHNLSPNQRHIPPDRTCRAYSQVNLDAYTNKTNIQKAIRDKKLSGEDKPQVPDKTQRTGGRRVLVLV